MEFRCKRSGNVINIDMPDDIDQMRKHEGYEEVKHETHEENADETVKKANEKRQVLKLRNKDGTT